MSVCLCVRACPSAQPLDRTFIVNFRGKKDISQMTDVSLRRHLRDNQTKNDNVSIDFYG